MNNDLTLFSDFIDTELDDRPEVGRTFTEYTAAADMARDTFERVAREMRQKRVVWLVLVVVCVVAMRIRK